MSLNLQSYINDIVMMENSLEGPLKFGVFYLCNVLNGVGAILKVLNHLRYLRE